MNVMKAKLLRLCVRISLGMSLSLLSLMAYANEMLVIADAWIPEAPPVARVMAGYMTLKNNSNKMITVTSVTSPDFKRVEIHRTETKQGMARMIKQKHIEVPAKGETVFKSGGLHLMLINPKRRLKRGERVTLILTAGKQTVTVHAAVKEASLDDHSNHEHHH